MTNPTGVLNPFKDKEEPKPDPRPWVQNPSPEEAPETTRVRLDGDSFSVSFENLDPDDDLSDVAEKLGKLLYDVNDKFRAELRECGIKVLSPKVAYVPDPEEQVLRSKAAVLVVETGEDKSEAAAFRKLGYALHLLPIKNTLAKYHAKVHVRG
jgi:hypothetical protein